MTDSRTRVFSVCTRLLPRVFSDAALGSSDVLIQRLTALPIHARAAWAAPFIPAASLPLLDIHVCEGHCVA